MPFNSIPEKDFVNRESELGYLKKFSNRGERTFPGNILVEGPRGIGKTELLKQFYRTVFWEEDGPVPFYYSFRRATLKSSHFARDYFTHFVRQYIACVKRDPSLTDNLTTPLTKLLPALASAGLYWMADLIDNFSGQSCGTVHDQVLAAISAPVVAAREGGRPVFIMLDDFQLAAGLYESSPGDLRGLIGLFETSLKNPLCPHLLTGSPEGSLESIFADNALRGQAERTLIGPLPEDAAYSLFTASCRRLGMLPEKEASLKFVRFLGGNPFYILNAAKALQRMQKVEVSENDLLECYALEVSGGGIAFYWSSILEEATSDPEQRKAAVAVLMHFLRSGGRAVNPARLAAMTGLTEPAVRKAVQTLRTCGILNASGEAGYRSDNVMHDFLECLVMTEFEGKKKERVRRFVEEKYRLRGGSSSFFEIVLPMAPDAELVAAKAVEQIGRNLNLEQGLINQLQMALIESCINAAEHSGSHDRKVTVRISASSERIEMAIESPGRPFVSGPKEEPSVEEKLESGNKRGWGLKLMRKIMDDVRVERMDDRTRVVLVKNFRTEGMPR